MKNFIGNVIYWSVPVFAAAVGVVATAANMYLSSLGI